MQTLVQTLQDHDLGHLKAICELWGLELPAGDSKAAAAYLASQMLNVDLADEIVASLPGDATRALQEILLHGDRMPLADLSLEHGLIRRIGPGKRDREKPWRTPISGPEALWYRGLIATAFADSPSGPREYVFIPSDLKPLLSSLRAQPDTYLGGPAAAPAHESNLEFTCIHDTVTLLAALRQSPVRSADDLAAHLPQVGGHILVPKAADFLISLLGDMEILAGDPPQPVPEKTRAYLDASFSNCRQQLINAWMGSNRWNDLAHVPGLRLSGETWPNDPTAGRQNLKDFLERIPVDNWWSLDKWVEAVRRWRPSFQRPGGDFDSWYLQAEAGGEILRGVVHWDLIDGALLRYWITGPLYWLGMVALGSESKHYRPGSFRLLCPPSEWGTVLAEKPARESDQAPVTINPQAEIRVGLHCSRVARYQIARIGEWQHFEAGEYVYRLSPRMLATAKAQGLTYDHILALLEKYAATPIPPSVLKALERWFNQGVEIRLEQAIVLRLKTPELVDELMAHKATARFLNQRLGETTFKLEQRDAFRLADQAARMGIFIDLDLPAADPSG